MEIKKLQKWSLDYLSGTAILIGIALLISSMFINELSSIGWILIIFGVIWSALDLTLFKNI